MTAVDHQLVKRFRQDAGDRIAEQRRQDQVSGVTPMSTEDERQYARAVIAQARAQLAGFKTPKRVFFVDDLPRNAMGQVQKNLLREAFKGTFG